MAQHYSDPKREADEHALPDVEVWQDTIWCVTCPRCGDFDVNESAATVEAETTCPSCERSEGVTRAETDRVAWWWWSCQPGCLPDSDACGPFPTEAEALANAREGIEDSEDEDEED